MTWKLHENLHPLPLADGDGRLEELFQRSLRDGTLSRVFYGGHVRCAEDFRRFAAGLAGRFYGVFTGPPDGLRPAGYFWLDREAGRSIYIHFCQFREYWGRGSVEMAREVLRGILAARDRSGRRRFTTVRAAAPRTNRLAVRFMKRIGFVILGPVPDAAYLAGSGRYVPLIEGYIT